LRRSAVVVAVAEKQLERRKLAVAAEVTKVASFVVKLEGVVEVVKGETVVALVVDAECHQLTVRGRDCCWEVSRMERRLVV